MMTLATWGTRGLRVLASVGLLVSCWRFGCTQRPPELIWGVPFRVGSVMDRNVVLVKSPNGFSFEFLELARKLEAVGILTSVWVHREGVLTVLQDDWVKAAKTLKDEMARSYRGVKYYKEVVLCQPTLEYFSRKGGVLTARLAHKNVHRKRGDGVPKLGGLNS